MPVYLSRMSRSKDCHILSPYTQHLPTKLEVLRHTYLPTYLHHRKTYLLSKPGIPARAVSDAPETVRKAAIAKIGLAHLGVPPPPLGSDNHQRHDGEH